MTQLKQIVIAGGGVAAAVAAGKALEEGAAVTLVFPNGGATELSAGVVDVAGVVPGDSPRLVERYVEGARELARSFPGHPYARAVGALQSGLDLLASLAGEGGYALSGFGGRNVWLPNVTGTFTPNAYVSSLQQASVVDPEKPARVLVAGFSGDVSFDARAAAESYAHHQKRIGGRDEWYSTVLELRGLAGRHRVTAGEIADYVDTEQGARDLARALSQAVGTGKYSFDKVLVPPVLGFVEYGRALSAAREGAGVPVGEVQGVVNAVTGYRLTRALWSALAARGAKTVRPARVEGLSEDGAELAVQVTAGLTDSLHAGTGVELSARALVLATGGYLGGGLASDPQGTYVPVLGKRLGKVAEEDISRDAVDPGGQAYLRGGLDVLPDQRVAGFGHVFAAGDVLSGHNGASERSATGVAAATGYLAGLAAVRHAQGSDLTDQELLEYSEREW